MFTSASTSKIMLPSSRSRQQSVHSQLSDLASAADGEEEDGENFRTNGHMTTSSLRRKANRSNPQLSYAYGAPSDGRQPAKKPRLSKETSQETGASSQSVTPPPPVAASATPKDAATRYKAVREKQQQQKRQTMGAAGKRNGESPRRSARLSTNGSQDATTKYERRKAIEAIEEDQAVEDEEEEGKLTTSVMLPPSRARLTSPGQSRSVNANLSSFYLDAGTGNMNTGTDAKEKRNGLPTSLLRGAQRIPREIPSPQFDNDLGMDSIRSSDIGNSHSNNYEEEERYASMMDQRAVGSISNIASALLSSPKALFQGKGNQNGKLNHEALGDTSSEKKKRKGRISNEDKVYKLQTEDEDSEEISEVSEEGKKHGHRRRKVDGTNGARGGRDDNKIWRNASRRKGGRRISQGMEEDSEGVEEKEKGKDVVQDDEERENSDRELKKQFRAGLEQLKEYDWKSKLTTSTLPWWAYVLGALLLLGSLNFGTRDHSVIDYESIFKDQMPSSESTSLSDVSKRIKTLESAYEALKVAGTNAAKNGKSLADRVASLEIDNDSFLKKYTSSHTALQEQLKEILQDSSAIRKEMNKVALRLEGMHSKSQVERKAADDVVENRLKDLESQLKQNDRLMNRISERAKSAETIALQTKESLQWLDKKLPAEIAVPLQKGTNKPTLDASTWQQLKQIFIAREDVDFQRKNEEAVRTLSREMIDKEIQTGAVLSRDSFLELLQEELEKVKSNLETQFNANAGEIQNDILAKIRAQQDMFEQSGSWTKKESASSTSSSSSIIDADNIDLLTKDGSNAKEAILTLIEGALEVYSADRIARRDYALYSAGGRVIPSLTSPTYKLQNPSFFSWKSSGSGRQETAKPPVVALHHDSTPGMCWAFQGEDGQLGIGLARKVIVSDISLEHVPASISLEAGSSAPRDVTVWGLVERQSDRNRLSAFRQGKDTSSSSMDDSPTPAPPSSNHLLLSSFTYDAHSTRSIQTFPSSFEAKYLQIPVSVVQIRITSNHGNRDFTCLYRIRIHGQEWTWDNEQEASS